MKASHDVVHDIHNVYDDVMRALYDVDIDMCMSMVPLLFGPPTYAKTYGFVGFSTPEL